MTFLTYALLIVWIPACMAAAWFIIRPARSVPPFATRLRAFLMLLAFTFGIPVVAALIAPENMRSKPGEANKPAPVAEAPPLAPETKPAPPGPAATVDPNDVAQHPKRYLELSGVKTARGDEGAVLLSGKIFNGADLTIRNAKLKCYLSKGSNDAGAVSRALRRTIPAGEEIAFENLNMGVSNGAWDHEVCEIVDAEVVGKKD